MTMIMNYDRINNAIQEIFVNKNICSVFLFFSFLSVSAVFYSCNNNTESKLVYSEQDTIKEKVKDKVHDITWTVEVEPERLTTPINRSAWQLGSEVPFTTDFIRLSKSFQKPVFPELTDFGSLDTSAIKTSVKEKVNSFCNSLSDLSDVEASNFFSSKYVFCYVFFKKDLENGWINNFSTDFPKDSKLFSKWIFGQPFYGEDILQIPVRFFCQYGLIDVIIYMNPNGNNEFYQIAIDRWGKNYDGAAK